MKYGPTPYDHYAAAALQALIQQEAATNAVFAELLWRSDHEGSETRRGLAMVASEIAEMMMLVRERGSVEASEDAPATARKSQLIEDSRSRMEGLVHSLADLQWQQLPEDAGIVLS